MMITINRYEDVEMKDFPFCWVIIDDEGCNIGFGWSSTEKEAVHDSYLCYMSFHE